MAKGPLHFYQFQIKFDSTCTRPPPLPLAERLPALALPLHELVRALRLQAGVTVTPGTEFSPHASDSIRLNFSQNPLAAWQAMERISQLIERYRA